MKKYCLLLSPPLKYFHALTNILIFFKEGGLFNNFVIRVQWQQLLPQ